jgi:hypothetical protein
VNQSGKQLVIRGAAAAYRLPLAVLKLDELARNLGTSVEDVTLHLTIRKLNEQEANGLNAALAKTGGRLAAEPLDFEVQAAASNGQTVILTFGSDYITREMTVQKTVDPRKATAAWYSPEWGGLRFVPSLFSVKDGQSVVEIKRPGNSVYTIVEHDFRFADMAGHWAAKDVELLANKLIVEGTGSSRFEGDRTITRAEFAALLVRALGLSPVAASSAFKDVAADSWYARDVGTAVAAGLINGYDDGTFRPDRVITREELAAMSMRALAFTGTGKNAGGDLSVLQPYKDASQIVWAKEEIASAIGLGLMNGTSDTTLSPQGTATRAESAAMLKRLLVKARFINE